MAYVQPGSRWEEKDWRFPGRILEVTRCGRGEAPVVFLKTIATPVIGARAEVRMRVDTLLRRFREVPSEESDEPAPDSPRAA
jgi:hypothetical protein